MNLCHYQAEDIQISEKAANWSVDGSGLVSNVGRLINGRLAPKGNKETHLIPLVFPKPREIIFK